MNIIRKLTLIGFAFCLATIATVLVSDRSYALSGNDWKAGRIIDDAIFNNNTSMNVSQIQQFLNVKMPACDNWGTQPYAGTTRRAYSEAKGVTFPLTCLKDYYENTSTLQNNLSGQPVPPGAKSAAQIIWDVSQQYGINPQVLIVLLQKEQNLILDDWPWPVQYRSATGYGCPDTAACDSQYFGFYNQVSNAARQFKRYANYPNEYNFATNTSNNIGYHPSGSCGSSSVFIQSQATASLYNYTPYQPNQAALNNLYGEGDSCSAYGNRNFWRLFTDWFGLTYGTRILKKDGDPAFYLYNDGKRLLIPSYEVYLAYGFDRIGVTPVSSSYLDGLQNGGTLTVLSQSKGGAVHLVARGKRYIIANYQVCTDWGLSCSDPGVVKTLDDEVLNIPYYNAYLQPLMSNNGAIYRMIDGKKQPFLNTAAILERNYGFDQITDVEDGTAQKPLGDLLPSEGTALKIQPNTGIIVYAGGQYYTVPDLDTFYSWGLDRSYYPQVTGSGFDTQPPTSAGTLSARLILYQSQKYLIDAGKKIALSSDASSEWPVASNPGYVHTLASRLPTSNTIINANSCFRNTSGSIFKVVNTLKRPIVSYEEILRNGCNPDTLIQLSDAATSVLSNGGNIFSYNRPFKKPNDSAIYMTSGASTSWRIPSYDAFVALGLDPSDVYEASASTAAAYPTSGDTRSYGQKNGVFYIYSPTGVKYLGDQATLNHWGVQGYDPVYGFLVGDRLRTISAGRFAHLPTGEIYYASAGAKHLLMSYDAYVRLGGNRSNTMEVLPDFINSLPTGQAIN